ncbi:MAG: hypothetical protein JXO72_07390 [Vicinamibacteria bacterium]|nr:hypothetical protein [Vicinamibacteria bacterium]
MNALIALAMAVALAPGGSPPETARVSEPCSISAVASKTEVSVGEVFMLDLTAAGPRGTSWTFPVEVVGESIELRTAASRDEKDAPPPGTHRYEATVYALGEIEAPPIAARYRLPDGTEGEVRTRPIKLTVVSILPKDAKDRKLADIREPTPLSVGRVFYLALSAGLLVVATLVFWFLRRRRRGVAPETPPLPAVAPDVEACAALARLSSRGLVEQKDYRAFYIALAEIAKRYLERKFDQPVLEMTSTEAVSFLRGHSHASDLATPTRDLVGAADNVKFAHGAGFEEEAERHLQFVRSMIDTLEGRLKPRSQETSKGQAS